jgi:hypothetical protein
LEHNSSKVKIAANVRFDEGMSNVPLEKLPPYVLQLHCALGQSTPHPSSSDDYVPPPDDIDILASPELFPVTFTHEFTVKSTDISSEF